VDSFGHFLVVCGTVWDAKKGRVVHLVHPVDAGDVVGLELSRLSDVARRHQDESIQRPAINDRPEDKGFTFFAQRT